MSDFELRYIAKIKGVWAPVEGAIIESQGWNYFLCKHNGYPYYLSEGYHRFNTGTPIEMLEAQAKKFNLADMDRHIANLNADAKERAAMNRWRAPQPQRRGWGDIVQEQLQRAQSPAQEALAQAIEEARAVRRTRLNRPLRRR